MIADMEAGLGTLTRMAENSLDRALLVANPALKSIEVVRRAMEIITERKITPNTLVIANRVRTQSDLDEVRSALNGAEMVVVPEDPEIRRADIEGQAPIDIEPESPAVKVLLYLARSWTERDS